jgi:hypothetical protein
MSSDCQRSKHAIDILRALQIPKMMIHIILKSAYKTETKALNLLKHMNVKIICHWSDVMEVMKRCLATRIADL